MPNFQISPLRQYIENFVLRIVNPNFYVRLSPELAKKYDNGAYKYQLNLYANYIKEIQNVHIKYPANAHPIFYLYIVPDDSFIELLKHPNGEENQLQLMI